jgi:hypothetical protein
MQWQEQEPSPRDILIDRVRRGEITPEQAERDAEMQGIGPLATTPYPIEFDPDEMSWWSLPMALAWIAWRSSKSVREHCAEYRENCWQWIPGSWNVPTNDTAEFERIDGYELRAVGRSTVCRLSVLEIHLSAIRELPSTAEMTVSQAEKQLFAALAAGQIVAIAKNAAGHVVDIPQREWPYLKLFEEQERDVLKHDALDREPAFSEINIPRDGLKEIWPELLVEPYMIEPMMRRGNAGYVPLCSALHWIMTEGGQRVRHMEDSQSWAAAVERLSPLISTGEVQIIGKPISGGPPKEIEGHIFAGILVSQPTRHSFEMITGDNPWINCTAYIDEQYWGKDFNDELYLHRSGSASWTHLQVRKSDILREIAMEERQPTPYETGAPGRPTSMHLIRAEFRARLKRGESAGSITLEADALAQWLSQAHPRAVPVKPKTIRNQLANEFRMRPTTPKKKE